MLGKRLLALLLPLVLWWGCAGPVQPRLWQPLPQAITLIQPTKFHARGVGDVTLPVGTYRFWYQNKFGYFFGNEDHEIEFVEDRMFGTAPVRHFKGGLWLSNREPSVMVYELSTEIAQSKKIGEIAHFAAMEQGDKDGIARVFRGVVPAGVVSQIGLKP